MLAAGAIVEYGENSNGQYWRWESGLQVCAGLSSVELSNTRYGEFLSFYNHIPMLWVFPANFFVPPWVVSSSRRVDIDENVTNITGSTVIDSNSSSVAFRDLTLGPFNVQRKCIAIGRWK